MIKVILVIMLFVDGQAAGKYDPEPTYETMEQCVADYREHEQDLQPNEGTLQAFCVSADEVKEVSR